MLDLGELAARITVDDSGVDKGLNGAEGKLKGFGKFAGPALAGAGLAAGAAFAASTMEAISQEQIAANAAAQYANPETAKLAGEIAGKLYSGGWGEGLEDVNLAVKSVMSSIGDMDDASSADIQTMTAHVMDLSKVMGIEVPRAAQIVGQAVSSGLAEDSTQAIDLLTKSLQVVPVNLREDLTDALDEYGPFLSGIGIKGEQAFGMLAQAAGKGMYGIDKTGDALKEFTIRATDGSAASKAAYKAIGLDAGQMARDVAGGGDKAAAAFQKTVDGLLGIQDPAARAQAAIGLFGTPLEDLSVQDIPKFLGSLKAGMGGLNGFEGSAKKLSDTVNNTASASIESFKRQAQQVFVNLLGNQVLPVVKLVAAFLAANLGPAIKSVGDFISANVMPYLRQFGNYIRDVVWPAVQGLARDGLAAAREALADVAAQFKANKPQIQQFAQWIMTAAKFVGGLLVPAMRVQLVGAFKTAAGLIKAAITVVRVFVDVVKTVIAAAKAVYNGVKTYIGLVKTIFVDLPASVMSYLESLPAKMYSAGKRIISSLADGMASQARAAVDKVRSIASEIASLIPGSPVKKGPLRALNNGRAGGLIVDMLADGVDARKGNLTGAFHSILQLPGAAAVSRGNGGAGGRGRPVRADLEVSGSAASVGRAILAVLRPTLRIEGLEGVLG